MKSKSHSTRRILFFILDLIILLAVLSQLQPVYLHLVGAVDGTFGLRPVSHQCAGLMLSSEAVTRQLPPADWEKRIGFFHVRYFIPREADERKFCLGQDIWFGE